MVNNRNVSQYSLTHPPASSDDEENRKIPGGPLYACTDLITLLDEVKVVPWTKDCIRDTAKLELDKPDLAQLIIDALKTGKFLGSEWCRQKPTGPWAACDAYKLVRKEWIKNANKYLYIEYYLKFAIGVAGNIVLTISCHPPKDR